MRKRCLSAGARLVGSGAVVLVLGLVSASPAAAAPGDLDPAFGSHGVHRGVPPTTDYDGSLAVVATPDGGSAELRRIEGSAYEITRLTAGGHRDGSFAGDGSYRLPPDFVASDLAVTPGGSVVVSGSLPSDDQSGSDLGALRLTPSGELDPGFGDSGIARISLPENRADLPSLFLAADGGMVLAAGVDSSQLRLVKVSSDGALDPGFATDGVSEPIPGDPEFVAQDSNGRLLVEGTANHGQAGGVETTVARYSPAGQPDPSYGENGTASLPALPGDGGGTDAIAVDASGAILIATVSSYYGDLPAFFHRLQRLDASGELDPDFDASAALKQRPKTERVLTVDDLAYDDQGRVLIGGSNRFVEPGPHSLPSDPAVARLEPNGALDKSFGSGGISTFPALDMGFGFDSLALRSNGSLVATTSAGTAGFLTGRGPADADADGVRDRKDSCPRVRSFAKHGGGCPRFRVKATIQFSRKKGFSGLAKAVRGCRITGQFTDAERGFRIKVLRVRRGRDKVIGTDRLHRPNKGWRVKKRPRGGRFYAKYPRQVNPEFGVCRKDRSRRMQPGSRPY